MYKYEMHCHTSEASKCGKISGADIADFYKSKGYDGIVITDHFFNGNTTVPKELDWEDRVELYFKGYENARNRGKEIDLDVFFGIEASYCGTDFLAYGPDKNWLIKHKDCDLLPIKELCGLVRAEGGYVVQAHPFREAHYIDMIRLLPRDVDAVETFNACRTDFENKMAEIYADNYSLAHFCGSDNHCGELDRLAQLEIEIKAESVNDILKEVMNNRFKINVLG